MSLLDDLVHPLDRPIYGARNIAEILNLLDKHSEPNVRLAYVYLEGGHVDAEKIGGAKSTWWSTPRRLLKIPRDEGFEAKAEAAAKAQREARAKARAERARRRRRKAAKAAPANHPQPSA
jgi:hypothetical protein